MKKAFKFLFVTLLIVLTLSVVASATEKGKRCGENVTWTLESGTLRISGTGAMDDYSSSTYPSWLLKSSNIKRIVVEEGVTYIGDYAFWQLEYVESVLLPSSLTSVGIYSFSFMGSLQFLELPINLKEIGNFAFERAGITYIKLPDGLTSIGRQAFRSTNLESIVIPKGVKVIRDWTFGDSYMLKNVILPKGLTTIEAGAFAGTDLKSIIIPESVTSIANNSFQFDRYAHTPDFIIRGFEGSYAQQYARNSNFVFQLLTEIIMTIDSTDAAINGKAVETDVAPIIENDRTMLPARFVAENLGATVSWDAETRTATIKSDDVEIKIIVDSAVAYVNGNEVKLDSPAFIRNDRTYTPVRFIAETLGATVEWDGAARQATITK